MTRDASASEIAKVIAEMRLRQQQAARCCELSEADDAKSEAYAAESIAWQQAGDLLLALLTTREAHQQQEKVDLSTFDVGSNQEHDDEEKDQARVDGKCQPDQPLTASLNNTTPTTVPSNHVSNRVAAVRLFNSLTADDAKALLAPSSSPVTPHHGSEMVRDAAFALVRRLVDFNERTQLSFCTICKSRSHRLHKDRCPVYHLHAALDIQAMEPSAVPSSPTSMPDQGGQQ